MANEATIQSSLNIRVGNLQYQSQPPSFRGSVTGVKGPVPGAITATTSGVQVNFNQLTLPGYCRIANLDATNFIEWGIWDTAHSIFHPLGEVLPGETYVLRLSRRLQSVLGTGTGTDMGGNRLMVRGDTASCNVVCEAFES